jgi:hypothetical protein
MTTWQAAKATGLSGVQPGFSLVLVTLILPIGIGFKVEEVQAARQLDEGKCFT